MSMMHYGRLVVVTCLATGAISITAGDQPVLVLRIERARAPVSGGKSSDKDVTVRVIIRNELGRTIIVPREGPTFDYTVSLVDGRGHAVPHKPHHGQADSKKGVAVNARSGVLITLQPGTDFEDELPLSESFDLSRPGVYYLRVSRRFEALHETIESNLLRIAVR